MKVGIDIDGVCDYAPNQMRQLMLALKAGGNEVHIITGTDDVEATDDDTHTKAAYLASFGIDASCWDYLAVVTHPHAIHKAAYIQATGISLLIDNNADNAAVCEGLCPVLVMWQTEKHGSDQQVLTAQEAVQGGQQ